MVFGNHLVEKSLVIYYQSAEAYYHTTEVHVHVYVWMTWSYTMYYTCMSYLTFQYRNIMLICIIYTGSVQFKDWVLCVHFILVHVHVYTCSSLCLTLSSCIRVHVHVHVQVMDVCVVVDGTNYINGLPTSFLLSSNHIGKQYNYIAKLWTYYMYNVHVNACIEYT